MNKQKGKGKEKEDKVRGAKDTNIIPGDHVLLQNMTIAHKLTTIFNENEYEVVERKGNELSLTKEGKICQEDTKTNTD